MPCCKAEEYKWCVDLDAVYEDEEGKEYCVFHAPQGKKGISSFREFNELVFERINEAKEENKLCDLSGTIFEGDINFGRFQEDNPLPSISFSYTTFSGDADFIGATFSRGAYFAVTKFSGYAHFGGATFSGETLFYWTEFIEDKNFGNVNFIDIRIKEKVRFENVNLKKVSFIDTDLRKIDFINCTWPKRYGRNVLCDELKLFEEIASDIKKGNLLYRLKQRFKGNPSEILKREWSGFKKDISCNKEQIEKVRTLYLRLKQKCKEERDEPMVSMWHYGEKEMFRKGSRLRRFIPITLSNLYWFSSGYAERPVRAGIVLLLLICGLSILLAHSGLVPLEGASNWIQEIKGLADIKDLRTLGTVVLNTFQYATFQKEPYFKPETLLGGYLKLKLLAQLLIPIQTALFALAVRNKLRR